eukprot:Hpha_TRINITY_DN15687_c5_g12::TRINITY_DN15687_c5_g12_i2::g.99157::m.99157
MGLLENLRPAGSRFLRGEIVEMEPLTAWQQRDDSLDPPPYKGPWKGVVEDGLFHGDEFYDSLDPQTVHRGAYGDASVLPDVAEEPGWADLDWEQVRRGQALFRKHQGGIFAGLSFALLMGFSSRRQAVILAASGYANTPAIAHHRYLETAFHIQDWYAHDLRDPKSQARLSLKKVRAMHSFARRKMIEKGVYEVERDGVPISQFDLAQTQIMFTSVSIEVMMTLGVELSEENLADMVSVFRVVGYYLGIKDSCNICHSLEANRAYLRDQLSWSINLFASCPSEGKLLQRVVSQGWGENLPLGVNYWRAVMHMMPLMLLHNWGRLDRLHEVPVNVAEPLDGLCTLFKTLHTVRLAAVQWLPCPSEDSWLHYPRRRMREQMSRQLDHIRKLALEDKIAFQAYQRRDRRMSAMTDRYVWGAEGGKKTRKSNAGVNNFRSNPKT